LLNRRSLLYLQKGRGGGAGAYRGARWDSADDIRRLLAELPVTEVLLQSAVFLPDGGAVARAIETIVSPRRLFGGFLLVSGSLDPRSRSKSPS
jgi:hypothetical protein